MIDRISTHVLDTSLGLPARGVSGVIERLEAGRQWREVGAGTTGTDGRIAQINVTPVTPGDFRITFDIEEYFQRAAGAVFYPVITVHVRLDGARSHYHLPVLAGAYSYATYLGS